MSQLRYEHLSTKNNSALRSGGRLGCPGSHSSAQSSCTDAKSRQIQRIIHQGIMTAENNHAKVRVCSFRA